MANTRRKSAAQPPNEADVMSKGPAFWASNLKTDASTPSTTTEQNYRNRLGNNSPLPSSTG
jgi:hypothetical protein